MSMFTIRCAGCDKVFTAHGHSQHIVKTRLPACRNLPNPSQDQAAFRSVPQMPSALASNTSREPRDMADEPLGDSFGQADQMFSADNCFSEMQQGHEVDGTDGNNVAGGGVDEPEQDPANIADANAFEIITRGPNSGDPTPGGATSSAARALTPPPDSPTEAETRNSGTRSNLIIDPFPHGHPGAPVSGTDRQSVFGSMRDGLPVADLVWAPFRSQCDWEVARWAKMRGPTSTAVTELLAIPEVVDRLGLSYSTSKELNNLIDKALPGRPPFQCEDLNVGGEPLQFYYREIIPCIRSLFSNPEFARDLVYAPERHYTDNARTCRIYNEMHTSDWWWSVQMSLEARSPGATVVPIIISTDKTLLTLFRGKAAYPIYMGIGNILKDVRRKPSRSAQMLIGYIPTTKLGCISNKTGRRRALANLFHSCMGKLLNPISACGETGIAMLSGDGLWRRCHPIFATFVGDYPEQALVTCTLNGRCPKCLVLPSQLGDYCRFPARNYSDALDTYSLADEDTQEFHAACRAKGLKPIFRPFWFPLPLVDIFISITPDVLHQLLQGVVKHITAWLSNPAVFGAAQVDARCNALPPSHSITLFPKGISTLSRVSGKEHKEMCRFLLGLIIDLPLPGGQVASRVLRAVRALLDFVHIAQYPSHTTQTLNRLEESLGRFHENKTVFFDLGVRDHLNIPKFHSLVHYGQSITLFGTTDNYNTEQSERMHIDFTKDAYRATNRKDEYAQMTAWLERREKIQAHSVFIEWRQRGQLINLPSSVPIGPLQVSARSLKMARYPTARAVTFGELAAEYGAIDFQDALADFIALTNFPGASAAMLRTRAADTLIPFQAVPVFHRIKFTSSSNFGDPQIIDSVVVRPEQRDTRGRVVPSRFDTVLVRGRDQDTMHGSNGNRIAQIQVVFQIPSRVIDNIFPDHAPSYLAYAEWFSPVSQARDVNHLMYKVSRLTHGGRRRASIISVDRILGSVHLLPRFGSATPTGWNSFSVLELCDNFYINPFSSRDNYLRFA